MWCRGLRRVADLIELNGNGGKRCRNALTQACARR
jgi:hypothetical protein